MKKILIRTIVICFVIYGVVCFQSTGIISKAEEQEDIIYDVNNLSEEQQNMTELLDAATYSGIPTEVSWDPVFTLCCATKWNGFLIDDTGVAGYANNRLRIDENFAKECISAFCPDFDGTLPTFSTDSPSDLISACYQEGEFYYFAQGDMGEDGDYSFKITSWITHSDGTSIVECTRTWLENQSYRPADIFTYELIENSYTSQFTNPLFAYTITSAEEVEGAGTYILPESDSRYYTKEELSDLSKEELTLARNEIYARHGRIFTTDSIREYFEAQPWYEGTVEPEDFSDGVFNDYEQANINLIVATEEEREGTAPAAAGSFSFSDIDGMEFYFASGVGAWSTDLTVQSDGSFTGVFHDSNMGDSDPAYPGGTIEYSEFSGRFSDPVQVNEYTWSFSVESLTLVYPTDTSEIADAIRYHYCEPYGLSNGDEWYLYLPGTSVLSLPEGYVGWIYGLRDQDTLPAYGLYDVTYGSGWIASVS